ncbi:MAG: Crp/Fnr family transcriptional regulator [Termitinemataceae bacterium]|nr:MAG: Crp/Fnr family transcriptional regulator [Termitinemataceae bacterium]
MEKFIQVLSGASLFASIEKNNLESLLSCLCAKRKTIEKGEFVFSAGDSPSFVGILVSGCLHITQDDYWGKHSIVSTIEAGDLFGEVFSFGFVKEIPVNVVAVLPSQIVLIDYKKIITTCSSACKFHTQLINNILNIFAKKNYLLMQKMQFVMARTTREKILAYLSYYAQKVKRNKFEIPFNRQELADYLSVDRSALSAELCRMRDDGILSFHKNQFTLKEI